MLAPAIKKFFAIALVAFAPNIIVLTLPYLPVAISFPLQLTAILAFLFLSIYYIKEKTQNAFKRIQSLLTSFIALDWSNFNPHTIVQDTVHLLCQSPLNFLKKLAYLIRDIALLSFVALCLTLTVVSTYLFLYKLAVLVPKLYETELTVMALGTNFFLLSVLTYDLFLNAWIFATELGLSTSRQNITMERLRTQPLQSIKECSLLILSWVTKIVLSIAFSTLLFMLSKFMRSPFIKNSSKSYKAFYKIFKSCAPSIASIFFGQTMHAQPPAANKKDYYSQIESQTSSLWHKIKTSCQDIFKRPRHGH